MHRKGPWLLTGITTSKWENYPQRLLKLLSFFLRKNKLLSYPRFEEENKDEETSPNPSTCYPGIQMLKESPQVSSLHPLEVSVS